MKKIIPILALSLFFVFQSCEESRNADLYSDEDFLVLSEHLELPKQVYDYELALKEHFLPHGKVFPQFKSSNSVERQRNNNIATLGRVLFYDEALSMDGLVSCASCHNPKTGFSDEVAVSEGVEQRTTSRNSLALATTLSFKVSYNPQKNNVVPSKFSWDDSKASLSDQVLAAFKNENEMNITTEQLVEKVKAEKYYPILFEKAWGDSEITEDRLIVSIADFVNSISSINSKFDHGLEFSRGFDPQNDFRTFSSEENLGKSLYNANCATCHTDKHNFTVKTIANNGLQLEYADKGVGARLNKVEYNGVFKVPFLRNIEVTAPYMHDGRFATLEDVIEHYSSGIVAHPNLSEELKNEDGSPKRFNFNTEEKEALVAYLKTLTDHELAADERFADPFRR